MLTKEDLQAIERIFESSFDKKFGPAFDKAFVKSFDRAFDKAFDKAFNRRIRPINQKLNKLQKDMDTIVRVFDSDIVDLENRTTKLEAAVFIPG